MFTIEFAQSVIDDLADLRASDRRRILDRIHEQLTHQPCHEARNKKPLIGLVPPWEHVPPVWELRIAQYRAYYDVNEETQAVHVRMIRHKPPHKTTEEIL
jgi:mRNA-degrading endonuclease RelE of RelBE toxin-antitoxin system